MLGRLKNPATPVNGTNGHNHAGDYAAKRGLHFVTFRGMVETGDTSAGAVVSLADDRIIIDGFGREPDRTLKIR